MKISQPANWQTREVNIDAIANKSRGDFAYTLIDTDSAIPADVVKALEASDAVIRVRVIK